MPRPVCADEGVDGLMFSDSLEEGMSSCLILAALNVELAEEGFEDQWCQQCHPCFQQINEGCVGAEQFEDFFGESVLEKPCSMLFSRGKDDCPETIVDCGEVGWIPIFWDRIGGPEVVIVGRVICIGANDGKLHHSQFTWYSHGLAM